MTVVPLPESPCVKCSLVYETPSGGAAGSRFYLSYTGSAPSGADCATLATDIATAWNSHAAGQVPTFWSLNEVDVIDIATHTGKSGQWSGSHDGSRAGTEVPVNSATNVEFDIADRYRGGKPRMFFPPGVTTDVTNDQKWNDTFIGEVNTGVDAMFAEIAGSSVGSMGTLAHVSLSYYSGFTNHTNTSGRSRAVPTYRANALVRPVTGYACKAYIGNQRRRLRSTTP